MRLCVCSTTNPRAFELAPAARACQSGATPTGLRSWTAAARSPRPALAPVPARRSSWVLAEWAVPGRGGLHCAARSRGRVAIRLRERRAQRSSSSSRTSRRTSTKHTTISSLPTPLLPILPNPPVRPSGPSRCLCRLRTFARATRHAICKAWPHAQLSRRHQRARCMQLGVPGSGAKKQRSQQRPRLVAQGQPRSVAAVAQRRARL